MYNEFARLYDRLTDDFDYDAWADRYFALLPDCKPATARVHECGCGTGSVSVRLARRIGKFTASDISESMLSLAQEKARREGVCVRFVLQDMRHTELPRPAHAIFAPCDAVNYLYTDSDLRAFFTSAAGFLLPGGVLAFDYSTPRKLDEMLSRQLYFEDRDDVTYIWRNMPGRDESLVDMELTFFVRQGGGSYTRIDERQTQKKHDIARLTHLLEEAGFADIRSFDALTENAPNAQSDRVLLRGVRME